MDGYQLVAVSEGISPEQCDELSGWGPAHDSLVAPGSRLGSVNFHRLDGGAYCLSQSVPAGAEYSGRSGPRVYTTLLLATPEQMLQFANQPFRILDAAVAAGQMRIVRRLPDTLPAVKLRGRASAALHCLLAPLCEDEERKRAIALASAICRGNVLVRDEGSLRLTLDRVLNILPVESRLEVTFSTGLKLSPQRQFRVQPAPADDMQSKSAAQNLDALLVDLRSPPDELSTEPLCGWWQEVDALLAAGQMEELVARLGEPQSGLTLDGLANRSEPAMS